MGEARKVAGVAIDQSEEQKKEVILEAQEEKKTVHCATLMDICHFKNAKLEPKYQKYEGSYDVLRGDTLKDDSGSYAVFSEQGFVCVTDDGRKSKGCHCKTTSLCRTSSRSSSNVHSSKNGGGAKVAKHSKVKMSSYMDTYSTTQVAKIMVKQTRKIQWFLSNEISTDTHLLGKTI